MKGNKLWLFALAGGLVIGGVLAAYAFAFWDHKPGGPAEWGMFGDFVGGLANPLLGFLTIFLLIVSLYYQAQELSATRNELAQSKEAMQQANELHARNIIIQSRQNLRLQLDAHYTGCLKTFFDQLDTNYTITIPKFNDHTLKASLKSIMALQSNRNLSSDFDKELKALSNEWKVGGLSVIANDFRGYYLNSIEALFALIEYSDSELTIGMAIQHLEPASDIMFMSGLYSALEIQSFNAKIESTVQSRRNLKFPEFHNKLRAI